MAQPIMPAPSSKKGIVPGSGVFVGATSVIWPENVFETNPFVPSSAKTVW